MSKRVGITPSFTGAFSFLAGSDDYSVLDALKRAPLYLPVDRVTKVYEIHAKPLIGIGGSARFAVEYLSDRRECFVTLEDLPEELEGRERTKISPPGAAYQFFRHSWREPTALLLPFFMPLLIMGMMVLLGLWNEHVLHHPEVLAFFANPGCDTECVSKVLRIHSMVGFLFLVQLAFLFLPLALLVFQAPRYQSALNYRMIQSYSLASVVVGAVIFVQLMAFFPFRQYGRFLEMGFNPKVERMLSNLKSHQQHHQHQQSHKKH